MYIYSHLVQHTTYMYTKHTQHTNIHTYIRTYVHPYIRTYVHTYIRTYIHTYIHTYSVYICVCCTILQMTDATPNAWPGYVGWRCEYECVSMPRDEKLPYSWILAFELDKNIDMHVLHVFFLRLKNNFHHQMCVCVFVVLSSAILAVKTASC